MIDAQTTRSIRCECCGFAFKFAASEHSTEVICPACGGENILTHCLRFPCSLPYNEPLPEHSSENLSEHSSKNFSAILSENKISLPLISPSVSDADLQKCRAKNCPRMKHAGGGSCLRHENSCAVAEVSEHDRNYKQWLTLLLTVCIQMIVLFGAAVFILVNNRESAKTDDSPFQVVIKKGEDIQLKHPEVEPVPLPTPVKQEQVKPTAVKQEQVKPAVVQSAVVQSAVVQSAVVKPESVKPRPVKPKPAVGDLAKEASLPPINTPQSQNTKETIASDKLPQTDRSEKNSPATSPFPIQPAIPSVTAAIAEPVAAGFVITDSVITEAVAEKPAAQKASTQKTNAPKTSTPKTNAQNKEDKFEKVKPNPSLPETIPVKPEATTKVALKKENAADKSLPAAIRIAAAEVLLEESATLLNSDPEQSLKDILSAVGTFEELGHSVPSTAYWILGQAYASLSWGKMFLINTPPVENMVISSDSHWLLTQYQDNSVWIWDLFRNQNNRNGVLLDSGKIPYAKLLFSPDLRLIIGGRTDGTLQIWDMARPNPAETPVMLKEKVIGLRDLQISPDGCWLAAFGAPTQSLSEVVRNNRYIDSSGSFVSVETAFGEHENYFYNLNEPIPPCRIVRLHSVLPLPETVYGTPIISGSGKIPVDTQPVRKIFANTISANTVPANAVSANIVSVNTVPANAVPANTVPANEIPVRIMEKFVSVLREPPFLSRKNVQVSFLSEYSAVQPEKQTEKQPEKPLPKTETDWETATMLSEPNAVWLWDLRQIQNGFIPPPIVLRGHKQEIRLIRFSADSGKLAVGGKDSTTLIYNLREGKTAGIPLILRGHHLDITAIVFAPNGSWVATGSRDNTVRLWNLTDSKKATESVVLNGHRGWVSSLAVDQSGTRLFSGSYDKTIRIWRLDRNDIKTAAEREPLVLQSNQGVIRELELSPDGKKLVSLGGDNSLRIRNIVDGTVDGAVDAAIDDRHSMIFRNRILPISKIALTPDNRWLVFGYKNQKNPAGSGIRLWPFNIDRLVQIAAENE
ncbi:MAG: hypothetical protein LBU34_11760 [Planctomycetaceae bacterium]|jgi:WD40 repeat protein|nr:hypothetical protein [Planctomycetaceae bacterium]